MTHFRWLRRTLTRPHQASRSRTTRVRLSVEPLEDRRTPATMVDAKTLTFQDADGDTATVAISKPVLTAANVGAVFNFDTGSVNQDNSVKQQLQQINLTGLPKGLTVRVTGMDAAGKPAPVDVGWINASGVDEASFTISGDVGRVTAGDAKAHTPGLGILTAVSMGVRGTATQAAGGDLNTGVLGSLGKLTVTGDVVGEIISVSGRVGKVAIGGSLAADPASAVLFNGSLSATSGFGSVTIAGDLKGGPATGSGRLHATSAGIGKLTIGGSVIGDAGAGSGSINVSPGQLAAVTIGGDLVGGTGTSSGRLSATTIGTVRVADIVGGAGDSSGSINSNGSLGTLTVSGNLTGAAGKGSGEVLTSFRLGTLRIGGSLEGGSGSSSALIWADGGLGSMLVGGSVIGGTGKKSASIFTHGNVGRVSVAGSWTGASIGASVVEGNDGYYGTIDDRFVGGNKKTRIGSIVIGGTVDGTSASGDHFGFVASHFGSVRIAGVSAIPPRWSGLLTEKLELGSHNDFSMFTLI